MRQSMTTFPEQPSYHQDALALVNVAAFPTGLVLASLERASTLGVQVTRVMVSPSDGSATAEIAMPDTASPALVANGLSTWPEIKWAIGEVQRSATGTRLTLRLRKPSS
jgi:hypothetical protein